VADGKWNAAELRDGPIDVDTWAVGQIAAAQYADEASRTARLMIGFRRPGRYDVKAVGHDLVITVISDEPMPAEAQRPDKLDEAQKRRQEAEAQVAATEARRQKAASAERDAVERAGAADREAVAARTRAQAARDELDRVVAARKAEEQRLAELQKRTAT